MFHSNSKQEALTTQNFIHSNICFGSFFLIYLVMTIIKASPWIIIFTKIPHPSSLPAMFSLTFTTPDWWRHELKNMWLALLMSALIRSHLTNYQPETNATKVSLLIFKLQSTVFVAVNFVLHRGVSVPVHKQLAPFEC